MTESPASVSASPVVHPVPVVCACIFSDLDVNNRVLLDIRHAPGFPDFDKKWQLPGGKMEGFESPQQALCREIHEELGVDIMVIGTRPRVARTDFRDKPYLLLAYPCIIVYGNPKLNDELRWFEKPELWKEIMIPHDYHLLMGCWDDIGGMA